MSEFHQPHPGHTATNTLLEKYYSTRKNLSTGGQPFEHYQRDWEWDYQWEQQQPIKHHFHHFTTVRDNPPCVGLYEKI